MKLEEVMKLIDAGYTKDEIAALEKPEKEKPEKEKPEKEKPEKEKPEKEKPEKEKPEKEKTEIEDTFENTLAEMRKTVTDLMAAIKQPSLNVSPVGLEDIFKKYFEEE